MAGAPNTEIIADGMMDFSGGIDSLKVTTIASELNPNGLQRNELAWAVNASLRDGGCGQRGGWQFISNVANPGLLYQGGYMYVPDVGDPYIISSIAGNILRTPCDGTPTINLSTTAAVLTPGPGTPLPTWTVTLTRLTYQSPASGAQFFEDSIHPQTITCPTNYTGPLGNGPNAFQSFLMNAVGSNSVVTLSSHYGGSVGDIVFLSAFVNGLFGSIQFYGTFTFKFQVAAFTPLPPASGGGSLVVTNNATLPQAYFCQAENFLVIQAGDGVTLPLFWDGHILRRSRGITNTGVVAGTPLINEIPAATAMDYYMGHLWYAQNRNYSAGDVVGGPSGTQTYAFRDSVLNVTESSLVLTGDGFSTPSSDGPITAIFHNAAIDASLGQGRLLIGTAKAVYSQTVPIDRQDWTSVTANVQPIQTMVQLTNGPVNDRSVVNVNGDTFFQSIEPAIRSLKVASRFFSEWGNIPVSSNVDRVFSFTNTALMNFASGITFDNRLLQATLPVQTTSGVVHQALVPIDFTPISSFGAQAQPIFEGIWQGLNVLQLFTGIFAGGQQRAFALVVSAIDQSIDLWEITGNQRFDCTIAGAVPDLVTPGVDNATRVQRVLEFPALTWGMEFKLKELMSAELWIDKLYGDVDFTMEYRPDGDTCWHPWLQWKECSARSSCEDVTNPICYPLTPYREGFKQLITLPRPKAVCQTASDRPTTKAFQFQCRLTILGWCRLRSLTLLATPVERKLWDSLPC